jgi:hypothetical protein
MQSCQIKSYYWLQMWLSNYKLTNELCSWLFCNISLLLAEKVCLSECQNRIRTLSSCIKKEEEDFTNVMENNTKLFLIILQHSRFTLTLPEKKWVAILLSGNSPRNISQDEIYSLKNCIMLKVKIKLICK